MIDPLYVDTSAVLAVALGEADGPRVQDAIATHAERGADVVSSRLLALEVRRVEVRERSAGRDARQLVAYAAAIRSLPLDEEVWRQAAAIELHLKTLDSLHLATCAVAGATLLTLDRTMGSVAASIGVTLHPLSRS